ncbi:MAG: hypothetical protein NVSMB53_02030 [Gemmatimonadaceae bacterium]
MASPSSAAIPLVRESQGAVKLTREEFNRRFGERLYDPTFDPLRNEIEQVMEIAWRDDDEYHQNPRKRKAAGIRGS